MTAKIDIGFGEWVRLSCEYGKLLIPLIEMIILCAGTMFIPVIGWHLFLILATAFLLALHHAYRRDCKNPPWYLALVEQEQEHDETSDN